MEALKASGRVHQARLPLTVSALRVLVRGVQDRVYKGQKDRTSLWSNHAFEVLLVSASKPPRKRLRQTSPLTLPAPTPHLALEDTKCSEDTGSNEEEERSKDEENSDGKASSEEKESSKDEDSSDYKKSSSSSEDKDSSEENEGNKDEESTEDDKVEDKSEDDKSEDDEAEDVKAASDKESSEAETGDDDKADKKQTALNDLRSEIKVLRHQKGRLIRCLQSRESDLFATEQQFRALEVENNLLAEENRELKERLGEEC